ncbi:nucleosome assembly protein [Rhodofomes roseus]|uniref:Nucleosome assembly protein n=1 Tax=Rhodofomes roseus TaxID=34475 RepID=A0ABQ8JXP4_9APHY|nr:nucleosome assembly protein [Rhodofomes roseus]KAH9828972.1 nucleosome assembly protein [Rhodofomes roseus]
MSSHINISQVDPTAPTPQNTPLSHAPIAQGLSRPTVPDISEDNEPEEEEELGIHHAMQGLVSAKLATLIGKSSGYVESLPENVRKSVEALKGVQVKQVELQNQYKRECLELEKKYHEMQKPLFERRFKILTGAEEATMEEVEAGEKEWAKEDEDYSPLGAEATYPSVAIPEFWLTALRNHVGLSEIITDRDAEALKHLVDIHLEYLPTTDPKPGFKLIFVFTPNDFFENELLEKTYLYQEEVGYTGDFMYDHAIGTAIKWKEDKDLTKEFEIKKQRNKNTNRTRLVRKAKPTESFFNFFAPPQPPSEEDDIDGEELEEIEEKLEMDYQIGEDIKEKIIPRAIDYFTGRALEFEDFEDDDEFEDIETEEDDEDHFDDEDSDSDDASPAQRRRMPAKGGAGANQNVNPEECKQQ